LNIAKGYLEMAFDGEDEDLKEVDSALMRMEGIVESLLTLARHTEDFDEEEVDMGQISREAWSFSKVRNAELVVEDDFVVKADRDKLMHVLENLFTNAAVHGGENVTVSVGKTENGFYVANDGEPIPEDIQDSIFDFGYTDSEEGSGLGLSIVKSIVDFHGWNVKLKQKEKGPRFEFTID
jgi:signal transduction histidine kinase